MSAFLIYAIILTLVYIIYYSAMITKESYAKNGQVADTTETFDFADMNDSIESVTVNESSEGFYIGDDAPGTEDSGIEDEYSGASDDDAAVNGYTGQEDEPSGPSEAEQHADATEAQMEDIETEFSDPMDADEYEAILLNPANSVPVIIATDVRDQL